MAKKPKTKQFKYKVLFIFAIVALVPILLIAFSNLYLVIKTRQQNIVEIQNFAVENAAEKVTKFINDKSDGLELVVSAPIQSIRQLPANNLFAFLLSSFSISKPNNLQFIDKTGHILAKIDKAGNVQFERSYWQLIEDDAVLYQYSAEEFVGKYDIRTMSSVEGDVSKSKDYIEAVSGKQYIGHLEFVEDKPIIFLASQIRNQNNDIIGVVSAEIELTQIDEIMSELKVGKEGYLYVLEKSGKVLGSGNKSLATVGENMQDVPLIYKVLNLNTAEDYPNFETFQNKLAQDVVFSGQKIDAFDWFVISEWPVADAFAVIRNILKISLLLSLGTLAFVLFLGLIFTRQITHPIGVLSKGAKEIAKGNLDYEIEMDTNDEFQLLSDQFNEMIEVLKENQKLRDEFVFIAAHELRTPVTAIKGYMSMLIDGTFGPVTPTIKENLDIVNASNDRLVQLVNDLLEIARSDAGKMKIDMQPIDIAANIKQVMNELKSLSGEKGIKVNYIEPPAGLKVMADQFKITEVITNLLGNAIKYTIGDGAIEIKHEQRVKFLITHIKDNGIGMTEEEQKSLFSKFFRAQNDETKNIQGTGLGLFIVKEIVERMGGEIWVKSAKGKGSTFSFRLKKIAE